MTGLRERAEDYLAIRRALGFSLDRDAKLLAQFLDYLQTQHASRSRSRRR